MKNAPLKAALIGCGRIGAHTSDELRQSLPHYWFPYSHADAIKAVPEARLVAVCDVSLERAQETAALHGVESAFSDYQTMLQQVRPDILLVATRTEGRSDILVDACEAGVKGIHFEKPLGRSMAECRRALTAADAAGAHLSYGTVRRCMDVYREARRLLKAGEIGELRHVILELNPQELLWAAPHHFDIISYFVGVAASAKVRGELSRIEGCFEGMVLDSDPRILDASITFPKGLRASVVRTTARMTRLVGRSGELRIHGKSAALSRLDYPLEDENKELPQITQLPIEHTISGTQYALTRLCGAVLGQCAAPNTSAEILQTNAFGFALAWSALHEGCTVSLEDVPDDFIITGRQGDLYA